MPQWDLANSDCIIIMGSNMAENHPIAFRFVLEAKERQGAKIIHVDPRFTRTSALADLYAPVRAGSDIAFLGGLINYILEHDRWFHEYVLHYTNIAAIIEDDFADPETLDGLFSGWDAATASYDTSSWQYRRQDPAFGPAGPPATDPTLQDPRCVYQILRRHYARYTPEMVEQITGCPQATFLQVAEMLTANSGRERTTAWCYAVGWTHHSTGVQIIRACAIIQALLGNVGRPGGGVMALRGHTSIQGSTDIPTLYHLLPGYLPHPSAQPHHRTLNDYLHAETKPSGVWHNFPSYMISLLRAWYGDAATAANEFGYQWLPKTIGDHSQMPLFFAMHDGIIKGLFLMGQNPAVGGQNVPLIRQALTKLDWLVVRETFESETASFWYKSPEVERGEWRPEDIQTEVFMLPAALPGEKEGTFTNTHRLIQWHDQVVEPQADVRSDLWFVYHLGKRLQALYADSTNPADEPIQHLTWDYPERGQIAEPDAEAVLREINGYAMASREQLASFHELLADGSTACGCWIYSGIYPTATLNRSRSRQGDGPAGPGTHLEWGYAWPGNQRLIYNRAAADPAGQPWSERKRYTWWDAEQGAWACLDALDFPANKAPEYQPDWSTAPMGMAALDGCAPFIMLEGGKSQLFSPTILKDGPLPTHYEPVESPVRNPLYQQQDNPAARRWERADNRYHPVGDPQYPYVVTTYRLTEHHSGGIPTRFVPSTAELQPEGFVELSPELAAQLGIQNLDWAVISTARGAIEMKALVTERLRPLLINGQQIYQVGLPYHFGWEGYATGDSANVLTAAVGDPNTSIHEGKAFTCNVQKGRLADYRRPRTTEQAGEGQG